MPTRDSGVGRRQGWPDRNGPCRMACGDATEGTCRPDNDNTCLGGRRHMGLWPSELKSRRMALGVSPETVARRLGITTSLLGQLEEGVLAGDSDLLHAWEEALAMEARARTAAVRARSWQGFRRLFRRM